MSPYPDDGDSAVLEFVVDLDGIHIEGVDIIYWNDDHQITPFKVMVRSLQGLQKVMAGMGEVLVRMGVIAPPPGSEG